MKLDSGMSDFFQNQLLIFSIPMSRLKSFEVVVISFVFRNFLRAVIRYGITFLNDRFLYAVVFQSLIQRHLLSGFRGRNSTKVSFTVVYLDHTVSMLQGMVCIQSTRTNGTIIRF